MDRISPCPDRVRKQLYWAFDKFAALDVCRFLSILDHEGVVLTPRQINQLVCEISNDLVNKDRRQVVKDQLQASLAAFPDNQPEPPHERTASERFPHRFS